MILMTALNNEFNVLEKCIYFIYLLLLILNKKLMKNLNYKI